MNKKIKSKIHVECCENGVMITIKKGKEILGVKVFEGKKYMERGIKWIDNILDTKFSKLNKTLKNGKSK